MKELFEIVLGTADLLIWVFVAVEFFVYMARLT